MNDFDVPVIYFDEIKRVCLLTDDETSIVLLKFIVSWIDFLILTLKPYIVIYK